MGPYGTIIYFVVLAAVFYFLFIRPQAQRQRAQQSLLESLSVGDRVVTAGGLYGTIQALAGDIVRLEIADGVVVDVARGAIGKRLEVGAPEAASEGPGEIGPDSNESGE